MSLYKTGTVSVNNGQNTVTGNGTSFIDVANVQLGDLFTVDGSKFYEIYQVDTNTQVRIRNIVTGGAFAETTVTDGDYAIVRNFTSQTSAEIAAKVLAVQQKWQNREEEMTDWFYTADNWADVTSINGDQLTVMTPNGINNLLGPGALGPDCRTLGLGIYYNTDAALIERSTESNLLSGIYTAYSPNNANASIGVAPIPSDSGAYSLLNMQGVSSDDELYTTQLAISYDPNLNGIFFRSRASGSFGNWNKIYHSGNTNFNRIGGSTADAYVRGFAVNATTARFFKQIHSTNQCTGILPTDGSVGFTVKAANGGGYETGVLPSEFSFAGVSSTEFMIFDITVSIGMTTGEPLWLQAGDSDSFAEATF